MTQQSGAQLIDAQPSGAQQAGARPSGVRQTRVRQTRVRQTRVRQTRVQTGTGRTGSVVHPLVLVPAVVLATLPLLSAYGTPAAVVAASGGALLGGGVAVLATARGWRALPTTAVTLVAYLVLGGPLAAPTTTTAAVLPTGRTIAVLITAPVTAWRGLLDVETPVGTGGGLLAVPYLLGIVGAVVAVLLAWRGRSPGRAAGAAVVPFVVLVIAVLFGTRDPVVPVALGVLLAAVLIGWTSLRLGTVQPYRVVALVVTGLVVLGSGFAGTVIAGPEARFVLRDAVLPPFDPYDHPSPLSGFRSFVKDQLELDLVTVTGLPEDSGLRLAVLDTYDGIVWRTGGAQGGSGAFRPVGSTISSDASGRTATVEVEVHGLDGVWLPTVGYATGLRFEGPRGTELTDAFRYEPGSGAGVVTVGLAPGDRYTIDVVVPTVPTDEQIGAAPVASVPLPPVTRVPGIIGFTAGETTAEADTPLARARALEALLYEQGRFSHGITSTGDHPSLAGHGADRMVILLGSDMMVGDGEQYAAAMALMAREVGLPARVVLGFWPAEHAAELTFTGADVGAWVEIAFDGHGWVPFFPTPPPSQLPQLEAATPEPEPQPHVVQPPPPPPPPVELLDQDTEAPRSEEGEASEEPETTGFWWVVAAGSGGALALLLLPVFAVLLAKARRRRRRRGAAAPVRSVEGGWAEVVDHAIDLRRPVEAGATRREAGARLAEDLGSRTPVALAARADAAVFGAGEPSRSDVEAVWAEVDEVLTGMRRRATYRARLRARLSMASLRTRRDRRTR